MSSSGMVSSWYIVRMPRLIGYAPSFVSDVYSRLASASTRLSSALNGASYLAFLSIENQNGNSKTYMKRTSS